MSGLLRPFVTEVGYRGYWFKPLRFRRHASTLAIAKVPSSFDTQSLKLKNPIQISSPIRVGCSTCKI